MPDLSAAEDILQDVFFELVGAWLFRVVRVVRVDIPLVHQPRSAAAGAGLMFGVG